MTHDLTDLARRAVVSKGWRWMPGMRWWTDDDHGRLDDWQPEHMGHPPDALPDLSDPATLGCLLALVREAWGDAEAHLALGASGWVLMSGESRVANVIYPSPAGRTEAEAFVNALESAP